MEKLELKHLAAYLPYSLRYIDETDASWQLDGLYNNRDCYNNFTGEFPMEFCKPILRPLSDLTKEIEVNGEKFVPIHNLGYDEEYSISFYPDGLYFVIYRNGTHCICSQGEMLFKLIEWHFDVFGLIDKGLAIDINTL